MGYKSEVRYLEGELYRVKLSIGDDTSVIKSRIESAYKRIMFVAHPDRGGDSNIAKVVNAEFANLRKC